MEITLEWKLLGNYFRVFLMLLLNEIGSCYSKHDIFKIYESKIISDCQVAAIQKHCFRMKSRRDWINRNLKLSFNGKFKSL